jgi:hypothetical protein
VPVNKSTIGYEIAVCFARALDIEGRAALKRGMGEPAALSQKDRLSAVYAARSIRDGVAFDEGEPHAKLHDAGTLLGVPVDTLLLWLAMIVLEHHAAQKP